MSMTAEMQKPHSEAEYPSELIQPYRALSRGAVASLILAGASLLGLLFVSLLPLALIGFVIGLLSWRAIRRNPSEYTGEGLALAGSIMCLLLLVGGTMVHLFAFTAAIPEGYQPISFEQLMSDLPGEQEVVTESALALNGKKVYVRGYLHPSVSSLGGVHQFVVVADFETCCFGGQPKLTHMIEVTTPPHQAVEYSLRRRGFAGTLHVDTRLKSVEGLGGVFYQLRADIVQ